MLHPTRSYYLLATLLTVTISQNIFCMEQQEEQQKETHEAKMNAFKEKKKQEKERVYIRDNSIEYKMAATLSDHAIKGFMEFCTKTANDSFLEVVKRELDICYDNNPSVSLQLNEIASGITIISNAVTLSEELAKKEVTETLSIKNDLEKENRAKKIQADLISTYKDLQHLRNEHIDQLNQLREKRNKNFKPFVKQD